MEENKKENQIGYKIITVGNSSVGKTSIIKRFILNQFDENVLTTLGINVSHKIIKVKDNKEIRLELVDTAGQERYNCLGKNYFKNADGILFVFAFDNSESFEDISNWIKIFEEYGDNKNINKYLVGNKNDLIDDINVREEDIKQFLINHNDFTYKSISAKREDNCVNDLFQELGEKIYERDIKDGNPLRKTSIRLTKEKKVTKKQCALKKCIL